MPINELYDITIIGGGPVGLFTAFYAGMRKAKTKIIESLPQLGGQLAMLYPEKKIYDIAGFPEIQANTLIDNLTQQISRFNHTILLEEEVLDIQSIEDNVLKITTSKGTHYSKSIIITAGNGSFQPRRLNVSGAEACEGQSLHYFVNNLNQFANQNVMICGGGDSAIDWALMLEPIANSVTLVHRRNNFRAHEHSIDLLRSSTIQVKTPFVIEDIFHTDGLINAIKINNPKETIQEMLSIDHLFVNYGFSSSLGHIKKWQLTLKNNSILVNSDMSTNIPGVYAAGDISLYDGKVKLIATGFGEAPTAVNNALHYIHPELRAQPIHSTSLFEE